VHDALVRSDLYWTEVAQRPESGYRVNVVVAGALLDGLTGVLREPEWAYEELNDLKLVVATLPAVSRLSASQLRSSTAASGGSGRRGRVAIPLEDADQASVASGQRRSAATPFGTGRPISPVRPPPMGWKRAAVPAVTRRSAASTGTCASGDAPMASMSARSSAA
jgi:hypothetical protein